MAKAKEPAKSLLDDVLDQVQNAQPGFKPWIERLAPELRADLETIRQRYIAGELDYQQKALATTIVKVLSERGAPRIPSVQVVATWLRNGR